MDASKGFLAAASLFFYSWWNPNYLPLILLSILFNFILGTSLTKDKSQKGVSKKNLLIFGIVCNVALLGYFKYTDFFISNVNLVFGSVIPHLNLALPLAISFFTFQQIAYLVDSYRGETKEYDFVNYAVFVTYFPQLIAGPIVHHKEMMPQFSKLRNKVINYKNIALGIFIFTIGLFKKVIIADTFATWATFGFDQAETLTFFRAWATSLSYTFQLYFDFSGYTDMAIGASLIFNITLPVNFNSPYKALSIQDFWRRWHITLSRFLKDYIYIPLGGNKKGSIRTLNNLLATFLIGGLWHGAGWTFIFWGFLHGMALICHRLWNRSGYKMRPIFAWMVTFLFVNFAWIFFRAKEWSDAIKVVKGLLAINAETWGVAKTYLSQFKIERSGILVSIADDNLILVFTMLTFLFIHMNSFSIKLRDLKLNFYHLVLSSILFSISLMFLNAISEFLYFNF